MGINGSEPTITLPSFSLTLTLCWAAVTGQRRKRQACKLCKSQSTGERVDYFHPEVPSPGWRTLKWQSTEGRRLPGWVVPRWEMMPTWGRPSKVQGKVLLAPEKEWLKGYVFTVQKNIRKYQKNWQMRYSRSPNFLGLQLMFLMLQ